MTASTPATFSRVTASSSSEWGPTSHYSGATSSPDHYVYTVQIPDLTPDNHLRSLSPVHPDILRRVSERLGVEIPAEAATSGKFFHKWLGNLLSGNTGTVKKMTGSASLEAEKAASAFLPTVGMVLPAWPTAQTKPEAGDNYALMDYGAFRILQVDRVLLDDKAKFIEGAQQTVAKY